MYERETGLTDGGIMRALGWIQDAYSKPLTWSDRSYATWSPSLREVPGLDDGELAAAVKVLAETQATPPSLAGLLDFLRARMRGSYRELDACADCDFSGFRQGAWHHTDSEGGLRVDCFSAACDCPKGQRLSRVHPNWRDLLQRWRRDSSTVATYMTSRGHGMLEIEERYTPDVAQKLNTLPRRSETVAEVAAEMQARETDDAARTRAYSLSKERHWTETDDEDFNRNPY